MQCHTAQMANGWQEVRGRTPLKQCPITPSVGSADPSGHKIYIWDISNDGQFASALDGGREPLMHVHVSRLYYLSYTRFIGQLTLRNSGIPLNLRLLPLQTKGPYSFGIALRLKGGGLLPVDLKRWMRMWNTKNVKMNLTL
jgi:hypothetical protein